MKRVLLSIAATVVGIVALLSFKTHEPAPDSSAGDGQPSALETSPAGITGVGPAGTGTAGTAKAGTAKAGTATTILGSSITTRYGVVQARITLAAGRITSAAFAQLTAFDGTSRRINANAAPTLLNETLAAQDAQIDTVSGATYTSDGYRQSLQSALDQAARK